MNHSVSARGYVDVGSDVEVREWIFGREKKLVLKLVTSGWPGLKETCDLKEENVFSYTHQTDSIYIYKVIWIYKGQHTSLLTCRNVRGI